MAYGESIAVLVFYELFYEEMVFVLVDEDYIERDLKVDNSKQKGRIMARRIFDCTNDEKCGHCGMHTRKLQERKGSKTKEENKLLMLFALLEFSI